MLDLELAPQPGEVIARHRVAAVAGMVGSVLQMLEPSRDPLASLGAAEAARGETSPSIPTGSSSNARYCLSSMAWTSWVSPRPAPRLRGQSMSDHRRMVENHPPMPPPRAPGEIVALDRIDGHTDLRRQVFDHRGREVGLEVGEARALALPVSDRTRRTWSGGNARAITPRLMWSLRRTPAGRPADAPAIAAEPETPPAR